MSVGMEMVERIRRHLTRNGAAKTDLAGLLASWNIDVSNREGRREVTDALARGGVSVTPPLEDVEDPGAEIVLRLGDAEELMAARPAPEPPAAAEPEARAPEPETRAPEPVVAPPEPPPARDPEPPAAPPEPPPTREPEPRAAPPEPPPSRKPEPPPSRLADPEPASPAAEPAAREDEPRPDRGGAAKDQAGAALRGIGRGASALWSRGAGALRKDSASPAADAGPDVDERPADPPAPAREPEPEPPSRWAEERKAAREAEAAAAAAAAAKEAEEPREREQDDPPKGRRGSLWSRSGRTERATEQPTDEDDSLPGAGTQVAPEAARPAEPTPAPPKEKLFVASEIGHDLGRTAIPMLAIGAATVMISLILPWYEALGGSPSDSNEKLDISVGWEWLEILDIHLMLMAFAAVGVAALVFQRQTSFAALLGRVVLVLGVAAIIAVMIRMANPPYDTLNGFKLDVETKIGPFVALVGTVLTTIGALSPAQVGIERLLGKGGDPVSFVKREGPAAEPTAEELAELQQPPQRR